MSAAQANSVRFRKREPFRIPHDRAADDLGRDVEVLDQPPDDAKLLIVLLAEDRDIRPGLDQELGDDDRDSAEEMRPEIGLQPQRRALHRDRGGEARRVHLGPAGREDHLGPGPAGGRHVGRLGAGIGVEILVRGELRRIDEDRQRAAVGVR